MRASYLEIYNETLNDLLNPESTNLQLRWQAERVASRKLRALRKSRGARGESTSFRPKGG